MQQPSKPLSTMLFFEYLPSPLRHASQELAAMGFPEDKHRANLRLVFGAIASIVAASGYFMPETGIFRYRALHWSVVIIYAICSFFLNYHYFLRQAYATLTHLPPSRPSDLVYTSRLDGGFRFPPIAINSALPPGKSILTVTALPRRLKDAPVSSLKPNIEAFSFTESVGLFFDTSGTFLPTPFRTRLTQIVNQCRDAMKHE